MAQQRAPPGRADAVELVEHRLARGGVAALAVEGDREPVRLVAQPLQQLQPGRVVGQQHRGRPAGQEHLLDPLRERDHRDARQVVGLHRGERRRELALAAVDHDEVRRRRERLVVLVGRRPGREPREAARRPPRPSRRSRPGPPGRARRTCGSAPSSATPSSNTTIEPTISWPWMFEMSKHSIRIGSDSRFSTSRSSSSASTRRSRFVSATNVSEESASSAFCWASSCRRRFSPRSGARTSTREPRSSERNAASVARSPRPRGHEDLRRHRRRRAVVLEAEALEHLERVVAGGVLEVERVAVDHPAAPQREDLHRGACRRRRRARSRRSSRSRPARPPGARPAARPRAAGCGSARRPRTAPRRPPRASAARARRGSGGRSPTGTRSPRRSASR